MSAHACVNVFHPTSSSTILWLSSDQKFQQPKYIIHKNKIKLNRTDDVCRTKKTRYTIKIYTIAYTRFFVAIDKLYQPIHILPNLYSHNAFSIPNFFFVFSLVNPFISYINIRTCLLRRIHGNHELEQRHVNGQLKWTWMTWIETTNT